MQANRHYRAHCSTAIFRRRSPQFATLKHAASPIRSPFAITIFALKRPKGEVRPKMPCHWHSDKFWRMTLKTTILVRWSSRAVTSTNATGHRWTTWNWPYSSQFPQDRPESILWGWHNLPPQVSSPMKSVNFSRHRMKHSFPQKFT